MTETATVEAVKDLSTADLGAYREARKNPPAADAEEKSADTGKQPDDKPKGKGGFQARIDRLIKHSTTVEQEREQAHARIKELEAKLNGGKQEEAAPPSVEGEPAREAYDSDAAYFKALAKWEVKQEMAEAEKERGRKDAEASHKALIATYNERAIEAQSRHDDWKEVVSQPITIPGAVGMAILRMENGPDVAYHLGKNPELCEELMGMDELTAVGRAFEVSRELKADKTEDADEDDGEAEEKDEEEEAEPAKARVPKPIKPVGSGSSKTSTIPLDRAPLDVYRKARQAGRTK